MPVSLREAMALKYAPAESLPDVAPACLWEVMDSVDTVKANGELVFTLPWHG